MNSITKISRKDLYKLVWETPMTRLAKSFSISDMGLRKICIKYSIPLPKSGYWSKLNHGKKTKMPNLPTIQGNQDPIIPISISQLDDPESKLKMQIDQILEKNIAWTKVPDRLLSPDPLIFRAKENLYEKWKAKKDNNEVFHTDSDQINIQSSKKNFDRALRIMNTFIKLAKKRGHKIQVSSYQSEIYIGDASIEIAIREKYKTEYYTDSWGSRQRRYIPTGKLMFRLNNYYSKTWEDNTIPLEKKLAKILATIELKGLELMVGWEKQQLASLVRHKKEESQKKILEEKQKEETNFMKLLNEAKRWGDSNLLLNYLDALEYKARAEGVMSEELKSWLVVNREKAVNYNPLSDTKGMVNKIMKPNLK